MAGEPDDGASRPTNVTETLLAAGAIVPDAFVAPVTVPTSATRMGWSADRAVTELYSERYRELVRLAALLVRDTPTAEEVVQDAFVAMHGGWQRLRDAEKALAYLRQAVVNRSRSVLRHRTVVDKNLQKAPPDMPSAEHGALVALERSAVVAALEQQS
jgi:DNA-directed RNA polymerase specialized sigma24 family protein